MCYIIFVIVIVFLANIAIRTQYHNYIGRHAAGDDVLKRLWDFAATVKYENEFFPLLVSLPFSGCGRVQAAGSQSFPVNRKSQWP